MEESIFNLFMVLDVCIPRVYRKEKEIKTIEYGFQVCEWMRCACDYCLHEQSLPCRHIRLRAISGHQIDVYVHEKSEKSCDILDFFSEHVWQHRKLYQLCKMRSQGYFTSLNARCPRWVETTICCMKKCCGSDPRYPVTNTKAR